MNVDGGFDVAETAPPPAIDTELAEDQFTRIRVRCDSAEGSETSTHSFGSSASSPLNDSTQSSTGTTPRSPSRTAKTDEGPPLTTASPADAAAANRFGVSRPILGLRRTHSTTELGTRVRTSKGYGMTPGGAESVGKLKRVSAVETRRAYALSVKARMSGNANVDDGVVHRKPLTRKRSGTSPTAASHTARSPSETKPTAPVRPATPPRATVTRSAPSSGLGLITPTIITTPRQRRDSIGSTTSSVSSISSSPSTTSNMSARSSATTSGTSRLHRVRSATAVVSSTSSAPSRSSTTSSLARTSSMASTTSSSTTSRVSPGKFSSGVPPPKVSVMQKLLQASNVEERESRVDATLVKELKQQYSLAEQGVQQLLKPASAGPVPPSPMRSTDFEVRRLKGGIKTLSEHSVALMLACEVLQRQQDEQSEELSQVKLMNEQLLREVETLAASSKTSSGFSSPTTDEHDDELEAFQMKPEAMEESDTDLGDAPPRPAVLSRRLSASSSLSDFVNEMLRTATEKIEEKWKARFAEKQAEHEQALAVERERASASVLSNSRLVAETKHEKEDELKAVREESIALQLQNKQLTIETTALHKDLEFLKAQLSQQDEIRNSSSFWEKTTDLAKQNRALTEELALTQQSLKKLDEVSKDLRTQNITIRAENDECVRRTKEMEMEKQLLQDRLAEVEAKFEDEKTRREQFQVNVEQLTVENTALYAQMVALQATHEAKMEELRTNFEKRNVILAGEMRALQAQNKLMRRMDGQSVSPGGSVSSAHTSSSSSASGVLSAEAERELNARLQHLTDELLSVRQDLVLRTDQIAELERKVVEGELVRRKLHNTIQELRGNIRVHVRLRPFLRSDGQEGAVENPRSAIRCDTFGGTISTNVEKPHTFAFDKVYGQSESQEAVFSDVSDFIQSALDGYNVCIFAYGQTGSGKTHTMQGSGKAQMRGIIPRALQHIINSCRDLSNQGWQYTLDVTFFEIYNESIRDLLTSSSGFDDRKYNVRTDRRGKNYVEGLTTVPIDFDVAEEQLEEIVNLAACNRSVDKTDMNAHSSRSHSIFGLTIRGINEAQNTEVEGSLSLVDLAGSERLSRSNATGDRLKEAQAINKSLSALADVFQALAKKSAHVPYRNSKLTYVLQPALSGDGKTLMMVNLSPTFASVDESVCSLRFAQNVSQCELGAPTKQIKARAPASSSGPSSGSGSTTPLGVRSSPAASRQRSVTSATPPIAKKLQF